MGNKLWSIINICMSEVAQSCPTLCDPMDCSLPDSSVHGIFQATVLEWIAISFSSIFLTQGSNLGLPHCRQTLLPSEPPRDICIEKYIAQGKMYPNLNVKFIIFLSLWSQLFCFLFNDVNLRNKNLSEVGWI